MKLLLDTHAFIWWATQSARLSTRALEALRSPDHGVLLSVVSIWEMQIKLQLGKMSLPLPMPLRTIVENQQQTNAVHLLPVTAEHVYRLDELPPHHKDPFDRLLLAQAQHEGAVLVSCDGAFAPYGIPLMW